MHRGFPVVTLCGSLRFWDTMIEVAQRLTGQGFIVLAPFIHLKGDEQRSDLKAMLDIMHYTKIDMSDQVYIVNVDNYIGESTRREIEYARRARKLVRYHELMIEAADKH